MYDIYANGLCIHSDDYISENAKVLNPKLVIAENTAGSLTLTIPPTNIGYSSIEKLTTYFDVYKNKRIYWSGRIINETQDFWKNRNLTIEGELAYLNDTTQPQAEFKNVTVKAFLEQLLTVHNSKVDAKKKFKIGIVTVTDPNNSIYRFTNNESTLECINKKLIEDLGGYIQIRKVNGERYLDYLVKSTHLNTQKIEFGQNLLNFTKKWEMSDFCTVVLAQGVRLENPPIKQLEKYLDVSSVNGGSPYVQSSSVGTYGWIERVVKWDDVTEPRNLLTKARKYLENVQFDNMVLELSAIDMHYFNVNIEEVKLLDNIEVISRPHGLHRYFPVSKMDIPLDQPDKTTFTLGAGIKTSLTSANNSINDNVIKKIENIPKLDEDSMISKAVDSARDQANQIMNLATNGFITITKNQHGSNTLYISDHIDYTKATRLWKWNVNGLGYSRDGGENYGTAITMDGSIVADYITSGTLNADLIRAGTIRGINITGTTITGGHLIIGTETHYTEIANRGHIKTHFKDQDNFDYTTINLHPYEYFYDQYKYVGVMEFLGTRRSGNHQILTGGVSIAYSSDNNNFRISGNNNSADIIFKRGMYIEIGSNEQTAALTVAGGGGVRVMGPKNAIVKTQNYNNRLLYSYECDKLYFATLGEGEIQNGECVIELDPIFCETIENDWYHIALTPIGKFIPLYYTDVKPGRFTVKADGVESGKFSYTLSAIRKGYKETYLEEDTETKIP